MQVQTAEHPGCSWHEVGVISINKYYNGSSAMTDAYRAVHDGVVMGVPERERISLG